MATVIEDFESVRRSRYPWNEWLDGQARLFVRGEDFTVPVASFVAVATSAAKARGGRVKTQIQEDGNLKLRFLP